MGVKPQVALVASPQRTPKMYSGTLNSRDLNTYTYFFLIPETPAIGYGDPLLPKVVILINAIHNKSASDA